MKKFIVLALISLLLSSCFFRPHRLDIEQGNIITQKDVLRLKPGMSEYQVRAIMGNPVLINIFTPDRLDYVYTYQPPYGKIYESRVICKFRGGVLREVITS